MSLLDSIKKDKEALEEEQRNQIDQEQEGQEPDLEEDAQPEEQEVSEEDDTTEENEGTEQPEKQEEKPEKDNSFYARMRIEKANLARENAALAKRLEELERRQNEKAAEPEQSPQDTRDAYIDEFMNERQIEYAKRGLASIEAEYRIANPDYDNVVAQYAQAAFHAHKINNPRMNDQQISRAVEMAFLERASKYLDKGLDPAEEIYNDAVALGFNVQKQQDEQKQEPVKKKPDLDVIARNKARSAGMSGGSKSTGGQNTIKSLVDMPLSEFSKISAEELRRIERGG